MTLSFYIWQLLPLLFVYLSTLIALVFFSQRLFLSHLISPCTASSTWSFFLFIFALQFAQCIQLRAEKMSVHRQSSACWFLFFASLLKMCVKYRRERNLLLSDGLTFDENKRERRYFFYFLWIFANIFVH